VSRSIRHAVAFVGVVSTIGIVLALADGAPDPGVAIRCYAAMMGSLAVLAAVAWLQGDRRAWSGAGAPRARDEPEDEMDPAAASWQELERALRFGVTTIGDYRLSVQPRLSALASARLARHGVSLSDAEGAAAMLGEGFFLVDPRVPMPTDRLAPGVPLAEIETLVKALREL
jgi:hypothetical protein